MTRHRPLAWPLRAISGVLVAIQITAPFAPQILMAAEPGPIPVRAPQVVRMASTALITAPAEQKVVVNRTVPKVTPPSPTPVFSDAPTEKEISRARIFAEPLIAVGPAPTPDQNLHLVEALKSFISRKQSDDGSAIENYLETYPDSSWTASLLFNLGIFYRNTGYFSKSLDAWEKSWGISKNSKGFKECSLADSTMGRLLDLNSRLGRTSTLKQLLKEIEGRDFRGSSSEMLVGARDGLDMMLNRPGEAFLCGPYALQKIQVATVRGGAIHEELRRARSTSQGTDLASVMGWAQRSGMDYQMAWRKPGSDVVLPAVVHWKVGHYAALILEHKGLYLVQDPTFGEDIWVSKAALDAEATGYCLVPSGQLPADWRSVDGEEGTTVWGKGATTTNDKNRVRPCDSKTCDNGQSKGMARYSFHTMVVSLNITDTPMGYAPPRGPGIDFTVSYSQRDARENDPYGYSNLGTKWTYGWLSYIEDNPISIAYPTNTAKCFLKGGGFEPYTGFNTSTLTYNYQLDSQTRLVCTSISPITYERRLPDGGKQVFGISDGKTVPGRKVFLTQEVDPFGNSITYTYDDSFRLVAVTDAIGQVTTLSYDRAADEMKITRVTDPFGRSASFDYDGNGRLAKITDLIGITSQFTYGSGDFVSALITPYGTNSFTTGESGTNYTRIRWLEAMDPLGEKERLEYCDTNNPALFVTNAPPSMGIHPAANTYIQMRNSYYWDKKAMRDAPGDYTKAKIYHWLHVFSGGETSGILESTKMPLENRVWYTYPGQTESPINTLNQGTNAQPSAIGRVLDGGTNQITKFEYNDFGKVTKMTDPIGRITTNTYSTNLIDLLEVRQKNGANYELQATFTYNTDHLPLTVVDAAGRTNSFGYNSYGQLLATTNARNERVTMAYDTNGYLTNITGSLPGMTTSFTYDDYGRVRTVTDSEGYTVTTDYDAADRPTKITHPDGTYEQIVYARLDPLMMRDRRGHWTAKTYDALQRVTDVQDALGRITHFGWCGCGSLESIVDPMGRTTTWTRDLQSRVTSKTYPGDTTWLYTYETNSSRIKEVKDPMNQSTLYQYYADNNLKQVSYSNALVNPPTNFYTYDTNYNRLLTMVDGIGTNTFTYYAVTNTQLGAGRLATIDGPWSNDTISNRYDELGRITNRFINGVGQRLTYDALGRVTQITNALGIFTNSYVTNTYKLSSVSYPNGQKTTFSYFGNTNDFRLQQIVHSNSTARLSSFSYTYDADGQIATWTQQTNNTTPQVLVTEYDPVDQLVGVTVRSNTVAGTILKQFFYGYDTAGNRTTEQISTGTNNPALTGGLFNSANQLTNTSGNGTMRFAGRVTEPSTVTVAGNDATLGTQTTNFTGYAAVTMGTNTVPIVATDFNGNKRTNTYQIVVTNNGASKTLTYDLNGNLLSSISSTTTNTFQWDALNQLVAITNLAGASSLSSHFTYDGLGRRVQIIERTNGTGISTNKYLWVGTELSEERNSTGSTVTKRFFGQGEEISGTKYFFTRDHLGSIREMVDTSGTVQARYDYDPYGRTTKVSGSLTSDFGFTGHYYHSRSGLYLTLYRAYDPDTGRWISKDPIGEDGGLNMYGYVLNDPLNLSDPLGLDWLNNLSDASAGFGDTISMGLTKKFRQSYGYDDAVDKCNGAYKGGEVAGIVHGLMLGGVHAGRNIIAQMGRQGSLLTRVGRGVGRFFYDNRTWGTVRSTWSRAMGGLANQGMSLHHWVIPQRIEALQGIVNAGFNYVPISAGFNSWMNASTPLRQLVEVGFKGIMAMSEISPFTGQVFGDQKCSE